MVHLLNSHEQAVLGRLDSGGILTIATFDRNTNEESKDISGYFGDMLLVRR